MSNPVGILPSPLLPNAEYGEYEDTVSRRYWKCESIRLRWACSSLVLSKNCLPRFAMIGREWDRDSGHGFGLLFSSSMLFLLTAVASGAIGGSFLSTRGRTRIGIDSVDQENRGVPLGRSSCLSFQGFWRTADGSDDFLSGSKQRQDAPQEQHDKAFDDHVC